MSILRKEFVRCDSCHIEAEMEVVISTSRPPPGWSELRTDGSKVWDICPRCLKEIACFLFSRERQDTILDGTRWKKES